MNKFIRHEFIHISAFYSASGDETVKSKFEVRLICFDLTYTVLRWSAVISTSIMRLLKINYFHCKNLSLRLFNYKYAIGSFYKNYSTVSIAGEQGQSNCVQANFIESRLNLWNKLKSEYDESLTSKQNESIKIGLQYGQIYEGISWQSTPYEVFRKTNKHALKQAIVARVNNELWDLNRPLETDCQVELLNFDNSLAKEVLWHSSAHVLGLALETVYGCLLNNGPATNNGFFYDIYNNDKLVSFTTANSLN